jgi:peptidyl-dipeptidase Dcp
MQKLMDEDIAAGKLPAGSKIEPWDWWYYAEKVRKQKYDLDEELTKPYFKLENVVKGIFIAANTLYGVNMEELKDVPSYNPEVVTTYKVTDEGGNLLGIFTTDYLPRSSKRGGAWMNNIREQYVDAEGKWFAPSSSMSAIWKRILLSTKCRPSSTSSVMLCMVCSLSATILLSAVPA